MTTLAVRFDFFAALVDEHERCRRVAAILMRPCFSLLERVSAHRGDRWLDHTEKSETKIVEILQDGSNRAVALETKRRRPLAANAEVQNGTQDRAETPTRFRAKLVFPVPADVEGTVTALIDLASTLRAGAGFVAAEPTYDLAHHLALGGSKPKMRPGLSERHAIERRGRDWHYQELPTKLAGPEWGTFLGAQHLSALDLDAVRASGAFYRFVAASPVLAFLQLTADPADAVREDFEPKLEAARKALAPILMDLRDVHLR